ncbi:hypothetical protein LJC36_01010 [Desulfovibrio sp. OttesenSCG-928-C14]|nr:hypothetical protein [Desulfovibrio sp. OttesenSCG-928-C14]
MEIKLAFKRYGESQPAQYRIVLLLLADTLNGAEAIESTAFLTEHPTAGWLWHFHDTRFHPRQPDANDRWAYYPCPPVALP